MGMIYFGSKSVYDLGESLNPVTQENKDLDFLDDVNISDNQDKEFLKTLNLILYH